jgi:SAM-dependent methyltransferase
MRHDEEISRIKARYERRSAAGLSDVYNPIAPCNALWRAELHAETAGLLYSWLGQTRKLSECVIAEIGCGAGANLIDMIGFGAEPSRLLANELLSERVEMARRRLPASVTFYPGDVMEADIAPESVDLVLQFTVFSSILDASLKSAIARRLWSWLKPGGAVLSYDFIYNNPRNPDVRKLDVRELRRLFPDGQFHVRRVTLAPPLARRVAPVSPALFGALNALPFLRSHALCLIRKA